MLGGAEICGAWYTANVMMASQGSMRPTMKNLIWMIRKPAVTLKVMGRSMLLWGSTIS
jgi:hypothetical protein